MRFLGVDSDVAADLLAPQPFAGRDQRGGKQAAEEDAHAGPDQAGLDRKLHQEDAAEREREPADPHDPARAEALLEAFRGRCGFARRRRGGRRRVGWRVYPLGRRHGFGCDKKWFGRPEALAGAGRGGAG